MGAWQIAPSEFWEMSMQEWFWVFDYHYVQNQIQEKGNKYIPRSEWNKAHEIHRQKMAKKKAKA